jgi:hypothetical protein
MSRSGSSIDWNNLGSATIGELRAACEAHGISVARLRTRNDYINALEEFRAAKSNTGVPQAVSPRSASRPPSPGPRGIYGYPGSGNALLRLLSNKTVKLGIASVLLLGSLIVAIAEIRG